MKRDDETLQLDLFQDIPKDMFQDNTLENRLLKLLFHDVSHDVSHDEINAIASLKEADNLRIVIILLFMAIEPVKLERLMQEAKGTNRTRFAKRFIKPLVTPD